MLKKIVKKSRSFYARWERPISSLSLIGGFVFDAVTLKRIDMFWENLWVVGHLVIVGVFIILVNGKRHSPGDEADPSKANFWYVNILQFFFGGILSTYLVFYFRSADLATSWLFMALLALAFWANESLKRQYARLTFQITLFFLSIFAFAIFLLPIMLHSIGPKVFVFSGVLSLILITGFIFILKVWNKQRYEQSRGVVAVLVGAVFIVMNAMYFTGILPPIPLSLKDAGVYYSIERDARGDYVATKEEGSWKRYLTLYDEVHLSPYQTVYAYSAVFAPTELDINIRHVWQRFDDESGKWIEEETIDLPLVGGREGGYRTYSLKNRLSPGKWRVNVETLTGHVMGRIRFEVMLTLDPVATTTEVLR